MKKLILLVALSLALPLTAFADFKPVAFDMVLDGYNGGPVNPNTSKALRKMIAGFFEDMHVTKYIQLEAPRKNGFHVCLEVKDQNGYNFIVGELNTISAGSQHVWNITELENCDSKPETPKNF